MWVQLSSITLTINFFSNLELVNPINPRKEGYGVSRLAEMVVEEIEHLKEIPGVRITPVVFRDRPMSRVEHDVLETSADEICQLETQIAELEVKLFKRRVKLNSLRRRRERFIEERVIVTGIPMDPYDEELIRVEELLNESE